jgi:hypothetical protein
LSNETAPPRRTSVSSSSPARGRGGEPRELTRNCGAEIDRGPRSRTAFDQPKWTQAAQGLSTVKSRPDERLSPLLCRKRPSPVGNVEVMLKGPLGHALAVALI